MILRVWKDDIPTIIVRGGGYVATRDIICWAHCFEKQQNPHYIPMSGDETCYTYLLSTITSTIILLLLLLLHR